MSVVVLGDREVVAAFALGGATGRIVRNRTEVIGALKEFERRGPVELLLIQQEFANLVQKELDAMKQDPCAPLVVEVPSFSMPGKGRTIARDLVRKALGIHV